MIAEGTRRVVEIAMGVGAGTCVRGQSAPVTVLGLTYAVAVLLGVLLVTQ
jgi:hypothetical protein